MSKAITGDIKKISVIHGEESQALAFAETLRGMKPKAEVIVPEYQAGPGNLMRPASGTPLVLRVSIS